jgi:hypothetical protein
LCSLVSEKVCEFIDECKKLGWADTVAVYLTESATNDEQRYKWVENEFCGKHSTFCPRRFDQIAFVGSKIAKPLKTPHLQRRDRARATHVGMATTRRVLRSMAIAIG